jgi:hypothetical protein
MRLAHYWKESSEQLDRTYLALDRKGRRDYGNTIELDVMRYPSGSLLGDNSSGENIQETCLSGATVAIQDTRA